MEDDGSIRRLSLRLCWVAIMALLGGCSMGWLFGDDASEAKSDETAVETVYRSNGHCGRRGRMLRCTGPATIVLASFPRVVVVDRPRAEVWSSLMTRLKGGPFKLEYADPDETGFALRYTGRARPFVTCGRAAMKDGKIQMRAIDASPGMLDARLLVRLEDAEAGRTKVQVETRQVLKHKDEAIANLIDIPNRSVVELEDGRLCWSTGSLETSALAPGQQAAP